MRSKHKTWVLRTLVLPVALHALVGCGPDAADERTDGADETSIVDASAGPLNAKRSSGYNCKPDKRVDVSAAIQSVVAQSSRRVAIKAAPGSDVSGKAYIDAYRFEDSAGQSLTIRPDSADGCPFALDDDEYNFNVEGLQPGMRYRVTAQTRDLCYNMVESAAVEISMPNDAPEATAPVATAPMSARVTVFIGASPGLKLYASDDTAVAKVSFFVTGADGVRAAQFQHNYAGLHGWSDSRGEVYYTIFSREYWGLPVLVEAEVIDVFGNLTTTSTQMTVSSQ